jgi:O-antigen ligase
VAHPWFPLIRLGAVIAGWALWAWRPSLGWSLGLAVVPWAVEALSGRRPYSRPVVDLAMALFLLSAAVGLWASYDPLALQAVFPHPAGWGKLWGLLLATVLYYALVGDAPAGSRRWMWAALTGLGAAVAILFVCTHDWDAEPAKWEPITRLGRQIQSALPSLPGGILNPNVSAGILAPLLPLSLGLASQARSDRLSGLWVIWGWATAAAIVAGLVFTTSRGAWAGLGASALLVAGWQVGARLSPGRRSSGAWAAGVLAGGLVGLLFLGLLSPLRTALLRSEALSNRLAIFSQALLLVRDYPFTGCGLGQFPLVHSTYALLTHVPVLSHAHALLLNVAVEQGVAGALALLASWLAAGWMGVRELIRSSESRPMLAAGLLSLVSLAVHSTVDDALYSSRGVLFLWVPLAAVVSSLPRDGAPSLSPRWRQALAIGAALGVGLALLLGGRALTAAWHANLGAVAQTRVELRAYDYNHFDDPTLDQIRQRADLSSAEAQFSRALALSPGQAAARTRLSSIALSRRDYEQGLLHALAAWNAGHRDRVTRLLLGDALVAVGQVEEAVEVVRGLAWARDRFMQQAYYRYARGGDSKRSAAAWSAAAALGPQSSGAVH